MNILLVTDEMIPGGIARHVTDLANGLLERGHSVIVAATDGPMRSRLDPRIRFIPLHLLASDNQGKNYAGIIVSVWTLRRLVRQNRIDLVHTHKRLSDLIGRVVARWMGVRHVSTCHSLLDGLRFLSRFGDQTITSSDAARDALVHRFGKEPSEVQTIHLGIKPLPRQTAADIVNTKRRIGAGQRRIIASVGRFDQLKDRLTLLRAIHILQREHRMDDCVLVLVGDGPERPMLQNTIRDLGIGLSVIMLDSSENVVDIFNAAEFCVISSIREGGTLYVNLEAASLNKPHVATNVGGIPEFVIDGETGLLVAPKSPEKLAEAISRLMRDPEEVQRLGENAHLRYTKYHDYDRFIEETINVYREVLEKQGRHASVENEVGR